MLPDLITEPSNRPKNQPFHKIWIFVALLAFPIAGGYFYFQKTKSTQSTSTKCIIIHNQPTQIAEKGLNFGLVEITIDPGWSWLSGKHPTVTFHGFAESEKEKIKYAQFAYHTKKHPQLCIVDATRRKGNHFYVKIRDFEPDDHGICYFVIATNKNKYSSEPLSFKISQTTSE